MDRELKFRAWGVGRDRSRNRMFQRIDIRSDGIALAMTATGPELIQGSIMQYTGIKDKSSVEIYEGDIVLQEKLYGNMPLTIKWCNGKEEYLGMTIGWITEDQVTFKEYSNNITLSEGEFEIIGNIYENPELLDKV